MHEVTLGQLPGQEEDDEEEQRRFTDEELAEAITEVESSCKCTKVLQPDPNEQTFWTELNGLVREETGCKNGDSNIQSVMLAYHRGLDTADLIYKCIKHGVDVPEIGLDSRDLIRELSKASIDLDNPVVTIQHSCSRPLIRFLLQVDNIVKGKKSSNTGELCITFMDDETARLPKDAYLLRTFMSGKLGVGIHRAVKILNSKVKNK